MKKLTLTWYEETRYEQTFDVEDDFDPELDMEDNEDCDPLEAIIIDRGEFVGPNVSVEVIERQILRWSWGGPHG